MDESEIDVRSFKIDLLRVRSVLVGLDFLTAKLQEQATGSFAEWDEGRRAISFSGGGHGATRPCVRDQNIRHPGVPVVCELLGEPGTYVSQPTFSNLVDKAREEHVLISQLSLKFDHQFMCCWPPSLDLLEATVPAPTNRIKHA